MATAGVFLQDFALIVITGAILAFVMNRLKLPLVLGYILAGVLLGPYTSFYPVVGERATIEELGELGVVILLFTLGVEFSFRKLRKVGATAIVSGSIQALLMIWVGYMAGRALGFGTVPSLVLGAMIASSSTVIIVKVLGDLKAQKTPWGQIVFGILIVEDVIAVLLLTFIGAAGAGEAFTAGDLGVTLLRLGVFLGASFVVGALVVPPLLEYLHARGSEELLLVGVLAIGLSTALLASALGFSAALGAFVGGALVAESRHAAHAEHRIAPLRDVFTAVFFVSVGLLVDPAGLISQWPAVLTVAAAVIVGKIVAGAVATFLAGNDADTSIHVGFSLAQTGEFAFVIATAALPLLGPEAATLYVVAVSVTALTSFTTPLLIRQAGAAARGFQRVAPRPILTFAALHGVWMARLRSARSGKRGDRGISGPATFVALYGALVVGSVLAAAPLATYAAHFLEGPLGGRAKAVAAWVIAGALALPAFFLFVRALSRLGSVLADRVLPESAATSGGTGAVHGVVARTFLLMGVLVLAVTTLLVASPFFPAPNILLVAVAFAVAASGFLLYRALSRFQSRVDRVLEQALDTSAPSPEEAQPPLLGEVWGAESTELAIRPGSLAEGRTLRGIGLREATGASLAAVLRDGAWLAPDPDLSLRAGDRVVLIGDADQAAHARDILDAESPVSPLEPATLREVPIAAASPLAGSSLAEAKLRERTGASVIGIRRGKDARLNPRPDTALAPGDVVLAIGSPRHLAALAKLATLEESAPAEAGS